FQTSGCIRPQIVAAAEHKVAIPVIGVKPGHFGSVLTELFTRADHRDSAFLFDNLDRAFAAAQAVPFKPASAGKIRIHSSVVVKALVGSASTIVAIAFSICPRPLLMSVSRSSLWR